MKALIWVTFGLALLSLLISVKAIDKATEALKGQTKLAESLCEIFEEHDWSYHLEWSGQ